MDGAGTIFDRIEQKLSTLGANADIGNLKKASAEYDTKIINNPADIDSKMIGLELKVVMLARLLGAAIDVMETHGVAAAAPAATAQEAPASIAAPADAASAAAATSGPKKKVRRLRQNPSTGVIEEVEDIVEDNVIVADNRPRFGGRGADGKKEAKKSVFIQACDDEPITATEKVKK